MEECADPHPAPQTAWRVMIGLVASDEGRFWLKKRWEISLNNGKSWRDILGILNRSVFFLGGGNLNLVCDE